MHHVISNAMKSRRIPKLLKNIRCIIIKGESKIMCDQPSLLNSLINENKSMPKDRNIISATISLIGNG